LQSRLYEAAPNQDAKRKIDTFCKGGAVYHQHFVEAEKDWLSDLEKDERDEAIMKIRPEEFHEKYDKVIGAQRELIQELREGHRNAGQVHKGMFEQAEVRRRGYQKRERA
jgi:hypothetical protein